MAIETDLRHVIYALSDALDLVGVDDVGHGKRVGIMAAECGRASGLPDEQVTFLFDLGMLHDLGVSSTRVHRSLVAEFDWTGSQDHCDVGYDLLSGFAPLAPIALPVKYHHTRWEQLLALEVERDVAWKANLVLLSDRVDAFSAPYRADGTVLFHRDEIRGEIERRRGTYFAPELVDLFLSASATEAFWLLLEPRSVETYLQDMLADGRRTTSSMEELRQLALIFSRIVDAKSPFTSEHSLGVAGVARLLAGKLGLGAESEAKIELAGLLHDLGKLRVPDEVLDKPGKLNPRERLIINTHSFETFRILRRIKGFEEITPWAAYHHEEPGGTGYPFRLKAETLPLEARVVRVADIFQALVQNRPYRKGLDPDEAHGILRSLAGCGRVDAGVVDALDACRGEAVVAARCGERIGTTR